MLHIGEHIVELRRKRGITQDELARFLGVTKASVSKWENGQSYPDILLLPQLATYFDVTVDEMMGYNPQLSSEQIQNRYQKLARAFSSQPFEKVMEECEELLKAYYSCYPLLLQIAILWLNHFNLAGTPERGQEILERIIELCQRVQHNATEMKLCNMAVSVEASTQLLAGRSNEIIELLSPLAELETSEFQNEMVLVQAYQMAGRLDDADCYNQSILYQHLVEFICASINHMKIHLNEQSVCEETIRRIRIVNETYDIERLSPNTALQFCYIAAMYYVNAGETEKVIEELDHFVEGSIRAVQDKFAIHGDSYFVRLDEWLAKSNVQTSLPRDEKVILQSIRQNIEEPIFTNIKNRKEFTRWQKHLERAIEKLTKESEPR